MRTQRRIRVDGGVEVEEEEVTGVGRNRQVLARAEEVAECIGQRNFTQTEVGGIVYIVAAYRRTTADGLVVLVYRYQGVGARDIHAGFGYGAVGRSPVEVVGYGVVAGIGRALRGTEVVEVSLGERNNLTAYLAIDEEVEREEEAKSRIRDMVRHVMHAYNVAGEDVLAIGSDFDGIGGQLEIPSPDYFYLLHDELEKNGLQPSVLDKMWYGNAERVFLSAEE